MNALFARLLGLVTAVALALFAASGWAADLPKSGKYKGKFGWYSVGKAFELEQQHLFWVGEFSGAFFNDSSGGFMDAASVVCPGSNDVHLDGKPGDALGYCIMTDKQGDKAFLVWKCNGAFPGPCNGTFQWTGGTGKYSGIKGDNKFYGVTIAPTASGYSVWEGSWQLP